MLRPGDLSVQRTLPVFLSMAKKLGASGAGMSLCSSSTPFDVQTNSTSPAPVTEQLHMLCCETPSSFIMSKTQMTSASSSALTVFVVVGPVVLAVVEAFGIEAADFAAAGDEPQPIAFDQRRGSRCPAAASRGRGRSAAFRCCAARGTCRP